MSTRDDVKKWLDDGRPTSVPELAKQLGRHPQSIWKLVKSIQGPSRRTSKASEDQTEALLEACRSGAISDEAANRILGRIMSDGKDADRIKAIDVYDTRNRASSSRIGPPPPQSPEQVIARLGLMMQAADAAQLKEAAHQAGYTLVPHEPPPPPQSHPPASGPDDPANEPSS